jgi:predicted ester cyclase
VVEIHKGFSDHHVTIEDMIAENDNVVKVWSTKGTHDGDLMGIPPTNKQINLSGITIYRIVDGKAKECVWAYDNYSFLVQVGVIPSE